MDKYEISKAHWVDTKRVNEALVIQNLLQIEIAKEAIALCEKKIEEYPEDEENSE